MVGMELATQTSVCTESELEDLWDRYGGAPGAALLPPAMVWVSQLARLQRASLALCVFGGLTYREAAALLDVPPVTVADLLTAGLRELGRLAAGTAATGA